jgi:hypothetical protein
MLNYQNIHKNAIRQWNEADDWTTLLKLNKEFLKLSLSGHEDIATPYHIGPRIYNNALIRPLIELHDFGLLVTESQPAFITEPEYFEDSSKWSQLEQLRYLDFLVFYKGNNTDRFFDALFSDRRLLVRVIDFRPITPIFLNRSHIESVAITYKREALSEELLLRMSWMPECGWGLDLEPLGKTFLDGIKAAIARKLLWCQVTSDGEVDIVRIVREKAEQLHKALPQ